ncbi:MAG: UDP-N-acetylmuramate--L-alanine ligase [Bacteroidota bacterium]
MSILDAHKVYFLGIGGIGMSALARYFHLKGKEVSGYDRTSSVVTRGLEELGITVFHALDPDRILAQEVVIFTPAIKSDNVERAAVEASDIPMYKRAEVLGQISQAYRTLAVAGTHGKTTTSTMLTHVMRALGIDVTAFLGGISLNLNSNFVYGESDWLVVEADEYDRSFLHLHPEWAIITSLDPDHLDIYGSEEEMRNTYKAFARQANHLLVHETVADKDWDLISKVYGTKGDFKLSELIFEGLQTHFTYQGTTSSTAITLPMPGQHNVANMTAALALVESIASQSMNDLSKAVASFQGIYRRFEVHLHSESLTYIDDYAHHPSEIAAAIDTGRRLFPQRKLVVVFQPHLFSRTQDFMEEFGRELSKSDAVVLANIYPAREKPIKGVTSEALASCISTEVHWVGEKENIVSVLSGVIEYPALLLTLGAGDIDKEVPKVAAWVKSSVQNVELS